MALYKEVQEYYDSGLQIPDDITLLFADDNFGTIRRLPFGEEVSRRGRSGVCSVIPIMRYLVNCPRFITTLNMLASPEATNG
jgi:hypothetical protein